jgi:transcriptional antiterminator NusG
VASYLETRDLESYVAEFPRSPGTRPGSVRDQRGRLVFPGYVFLRIPPAFDSWQTVRWAPGVRKVLEQDGVPAAVAAGVVNHLRRRIAGYVTRRNRVGFEPGETVIVERGPLAAIDAIFERELDANRRVQILIDMMGRQVSVTIDPRSLRAS